jgi:hypothetical protein
MASRAAAVLLLVASASAFAPLGVRPLPSRQVSLKAEESSTLSEEEIEEAAIRQEAAALSKKLRSNMYV